MILDRCIIIYFVEDLCTLVNYICFLRVLRNGNSFQQFVGKHSFDIKVSVYNTVSFTFLNVKDYCM